jgi:hypothetical protein
MIEETRMKRITIFWLGVIVLGALLSTACGLVSADTEDDPSGQGTPPAVITPEPTVTLPPDTPVSSTPLPTTPPVQSSPPQTRPPASTMPPQSVPPAAPTQDPNLAYVEAPIDGVEILVRESYPPQYAVQIDAGLPSGCAKPFMHDVTRVGDTITIKVINSTIPDGICTAIYGMYQVNVTLNGNFVPGTQYTVIVNDVTRTIVAQ